jgi:hypothetical protein
MTSRRNRNSLVVISWNVVRDLCRQYGLDDSLPAIYQALLQASQTVHAMYYVRHWRQRLKEGKYPSRSGRVLPAMEENVRLLRDAMSSALADAYAPFVTQDTVASATSLLETIRRHAEPDTDDSSS